MFGDTDTNFISSNTQFLRSSCITHLRRSLKVHQRLYDGVVGGVHVAVEGKRALALAVEGLVLGRGDDPVLPVEVLKAHPGLN